MKRFFKTILAIAIVAIGIVAARIIWINKPEAQKKEIVEVVPTVVVAPVQKESVTLEIPSQGMIEAARRSRLAIEVTGKVTVVSPRFDVGEVFEKGEVLLEIDSADYVAALAQAKANLADAESLLASEEAKSAQAQSDWARLGRGGRPSDLVLRKPQLKSASARIEAAKASIEKAQRDVERCVLRTPYACTISSTMTELGSYVGPGAFVAEVFENDTLEIRLPLSLDELSFLNIDKEGRPTGEVRLWVETAGKETLWGAQVLRTEGEIDRSSRSIHLVAQVQKPSGQEGGLLQPGLFCEARVIGKRIPNVARVPFAAFRNLDQVVLVDQEDRLRFRKVKILRRDGEDILVADGLKENERLCLTEIPSMIEGTKVAPSFAEKKELGSGLPGSDL